MKYEISQQQYVDFLNSLTQTQATARKLDMPTPNARYVITGSEVGSYSTTNPYVACNWLSWMDGAAYSDWAGLRPLSELEYEKACRGTLAAVANEYAWGTATIAGLAYTLGDAGANNEGIASNYSSDAGNASYSNTDGPIDGPLRVGIFAANSLNTGRITAGASYYGIMELSGNLWEWLVSIGNATGRGFTGLHGDGALAASGFANVSNWPGTDAVGGSLRGGNWLNTAPFVRVSDRYNGANTVIWRYSSVGFRAGRSGPAL
jgi:formylglycine-generating enzyme required for sulfatase activity